MLNDVEGRQFCWMNQWTSAEYHQMSANVGAFYCKKSRADEIRLPYVAPFVPKSNGKDISISGIAEVPKTSTFSFTILHPNEPSPAFFRQTEL